MPTLPPGHELSTLLGEIMDAWGLVERSLYRVFAALLQHRGCPLVEKGDDREFAVIETWIGEKECRALFHAVRGIKEQREMTEVLATVLLDEARLASLQNLLGLTEKASERRNKIVHGRWVTLGQQTKGVRYEQPGANPDTPVSAIFRVVDSPNVMEDIKVRTALRRVPKNQITHFQKLRDRSMFGKRKLEDEKDRFTEIAASLELFVWNELYGSDPRLERSQLRGWPLPRKRGEASASPSRRQRDR